MTIKINYKSGKISQNSIIFVNEKFNVSSLKKSLKSSEYDQILDLKIKI